MKAIAKFHSVRSEKSALILVKANKFEFGYSPVYVSIEGVKDSTGKTMEELEALDKDDAGRTFNIPGGYTLVDIVDEDGVVRTTKDGQPLKTLKW